MIYSVNKSSNSYVKINLSCLKVSSQGLSSQVFTGLHASPHGYKMRTAIRVSEVFFTLLHEPYSSRVSGGVKKV